MGPDNLSPIMLRYLGLRYLTKLSNLSLSSLNIPRSWKIARVIPIHKSGKPADKGESYRPISILSPVVKLLEKILLPQLTSGANLAPHQHGFRSGHSTTTALHQITQKISDGFNNKQPALRTILVALDLSKQSKTFDTVAHHILFEDIRQLNIPARTKRWI